MEVVGAEEGETKGEAGEAGTSVGPARVEGFRTFPFPSPTAGSFSFSFRFSPETAGEATEAVGTGDVMEDEEKLVDIEMGPSLMEASTVT